MRYLISVTMLVFSLNLIAGETHEIALADDFFSLRPMEQWLRMKSLIREKHQGLDFIYCAAVAFHADRVLRYAFYETEGEAQVAGVDLYPGKNPADTLHVFPRFGVLAPQMIRVNAIGQASF